MGKDYRIMAFGKSGCPKCKMLNRRLDDLLGKAEWQDFEKVYWDLETPDGLVAFCRAECINPNRIPAFLVSKRDAQTGVYRPLRDPQPERQDEMSRKTRLHAWLGLQTDYGPVGRGTITPEMIVGVLAEARTC